MSEVTLSPRGARARAEGVACSSLLLGVVAMSTAGCLITSAPQFEAPQHTAPFLVASSASPDVRKVIVVDSNMPGTGYQLFSAQIVSQDDTSDSAGLFKSVSSVIYIDYGVGTVPDQPFLWAITGSSIGPGDIDQTMPRTITQKWYPVEFPVSAGCHTATLMVSHIFDTVTHCPLCEGDSDYITWQVLSCDSSIMGDCDNLPLSGSEECAYQANASMTVTCPQVEAMADDGMVCPDAVDAGAP